MRKLFSGLVGTRNPFLRTETEVGTERVGCGGQVHGCSWGHNGFALFCPEARPGSTWGCVPGRPDSL